MKLLLLSILVFNIVFCLDKLTLLDGTVYEGQFISFLNNDVIFKPSNAMTGQSVDLSIVKLITLSDGTIIDIVEQKKSYNTNNNNIINAGDHLDRASKLLFMSDFVIPIAGTIAYFLSYEPGIITVSGILMIIYKHAAYTEISRSGVELKGEQTND